MLCIVLEGGILPLNHNVGTFWWFEAEKKKKGVVKESVENDLLLKWQLWIIIGWLQADQKLRILRVTSFSSSTALSFSRLHASDTLFGQH